MGKKVSEEQQGCVYHVVNLKNGKGYVGKTTLDPEVRWEQHLRSAKCGSKLPFHCALRRYAYEKGFTWEVVWRGPVASLDEKEMLYVDILRTNTRAKGHGYNLTVGGDGVRAGSKLSKKTKTKMSESMRIRWADPARREKKREEANAYWARPLARENYGAKIRKFYEENPNARAAMSKKMREVWAADPTLSERKRAALKERYSDPKEREKQSEGLRRRYERQEEREKSRKAALKVFKDPAMREKLRLAQARYWDGNTTAREACSARVSARHADPAVRAAIGERTRLAWAAKSPEQRSAHIAAIKAGHAKHK